MLRFGMHMSLRSGREALVRLLVTALSVAIGVGLLLSALAMYHAYRDALAKPCWQCTTTSPTRPGVAGCGTPARTSTPGTPSNGWMSRPSARGGPVVPGLPAMPAAGQYYASPALWPRSSGRYRTTSWATGTRAHSPAPSARPGCKARTTSRSSSVRRRQTCTARQHTHHRVAAIQTAPRGLSSTQFYQFGFALGAVALLVPMLVLIGNATRMAAARREERYAAMRLVGAERSQINVIASVEAVIGAVLGALAGIGMYAVLRPLLGGIPLLGYRFFDDTITPTAWGYVAALLVVPAAAAVACLISLRRVQISPLGVTRRVTPPAPSVWRVLPLAVGLIVFIVPLAVRDPRQPDIGLAPLGLALIMIGLVIGGGWLTMRTAYALARLWPGPASLLAARRMADDPRTTFRSVSGLVLAVFVGTLIAAVVPAALAAQQAPSATALNQVMRVLPHGPVEKTASLPGGLLDQLHAFPGVAVLPIHGPVASGDVHFEQGEGPPPSIIACADLAAFSPIGHCAPGQPAVTADTSSMTTDNLAFLDRALPMVTSTSPPYAGDPSALPLNLILINVDSSATLERIRTFLSVTYPGLTSGPGSAPQTFGEVAAVRAALYRELGNVMLIVVGLTLLVAGASLAIAVGGGVIDRRRPFTLLRVTGTSSAVLRRVVLLEALLPLLSATIVAALVGLATSIPINRVLNPTASTATLHLPDPTYYLTMAAGLAISLAVIAATLPILSRVTAPDSVRFE